MRDADIARWIAYDGQGNPHPMAPAAIERSLARRGIAIEADAAWRTGLFA